MDNEYRAEVKLSIAEGVMYLKAIDKQLEDHKMNESSWKQLKEEVERIRDQSKLLFSIGMLSK